MVSKRSDGFVTRESGAAAFDWVILAIGVFGLALAIYSVFGPGDDASPPTPQEVAAPADPVDAARTAPLLYPHFDEDWRAAQIAAHAALDDAALLDAYEAQYAVATGDVNTRIGVDYLGVIEAEMAARGLERPDGYRSFREIHAALSMGETP